MSKRNRRRRRRYSKGLRFEKLERRDLLAIGEFSVLGGDSSLPFDPAAEAFIRYERANDRLRLRLHESRDVENFDLTVNGLSFSDPGSVTFNVDESLRFVKIETDQRGERFQIFAIDDFTIDAFARMGGRVVQLIEAVNDGTETDIATTAAAKITSIDFRDEELNGDSRAFDDLAAPAIEITSSSGEELLVDENVTFTIRAVNLPPEPHDFLVGFNIVGSEALPDSEQAFADSAFERTLTVERQFDEPGQLDVLTLINLGDIATHRAMFTIVQPDPNSGRSPNDPLIGLDGLLQIDPFDLVLVDGGSEAGQRSYFRTGAIRGRVSPTVTGDVSIRVTAPVETEIDGDKSSGEIAGPFSLTDAVSPLTGVVPLADVPIEPEIGREFSFVVEELLAESRQPTPFGYPRIIDDFLKFELIDAVGEVLDEMTLAGDLLTGLRVPEGDLPPRDSVGRIRPLDIDLHLNTTRLTTSGLEGDGLVVEVVADNLLTDAADLGGTATVRIDFGDGSDLFLRDIELTPARQGGDLNDGLAGSPPNALTAELQGSEAFAFHRYDEAGEFEVVGSLTLPDGRVAFDSVTVTVFDRELAEAFPLTATQLDPEGFGVVRFDLAGSVFNAAGDELLEIDVNLGDEQTVLLPTENLLNTGVTVPINVLPLLPDGQVRATLTGTAAVGSNALRPVIVPFELEVTDPRLAFDIFRRDPLQGTSVFSFTGVGDFFRVSVPLLGTDPGNNEIQSTGTIESEIDTIQNIADQVESDPPVSNRSVDVTAGRMVTVQAFRNGATPDSPILIDELSFDAARLLEPVVDVGPPEFLDGELFSDLFEGRPLVPRVRIDHLNGPGSITIDYGNVVVKTAAVDDLAAVLFSFPDEVEEALKLDDGYILPPDVIEQTFPVTVTVQPSGADAVVGTTEYTARDHGPGALTGDASLEFVNRLTELIATAVGVRVSVNDAFRLETLSATIDWRDGFTETLEADRTEFDDGHGEIEFSHTYFRGFLQTLARSAGTGLVDLRPLISISDGVNTREITIGGFGFGQTVEMIETLDLIVEPAPALAAARAEVAVSGATVATAGVFAKTPVDVRIAFGPADRQRFDADEDLTVIVDRGDQRPPLELVRTDGASLFRIRQAGGSLSGAVPFITETNVDTFGTRHVLVLQDLTTGQTLVDYPHSGVFTLTAGIFRDGEVESFGTTQVAVYPNVADAAVDDDGTVRVILTDLAPQILTVNFNDPRNGQREDGFETFVDPESPGSSRTVAVDGLFETRFPGGGTFVAEISEPIAWLLMPIDVGDPEAQALEIDAPDAVEIDKPFLLSLLVPPALADKILSAATRVELQVATSDGQRFTMRQFISATDQLFEIIDDGGKTTGFGTFDPDAGTLPFAFEGNPLLRLTRPGVGQVRVFGEGFSGRKTIAIENQFPSVIPRLEVRDDGTLLGTIDVESENGVTINVGGKQADVPPGRQSISVGEDADDDVRITDDGFVAGGVLDVGFGAGDAGHVSGETQVLVNGVLNRFGNSRPTAELNVTDNGDGTAIIDGTLDDADGDPVSFIIRDAFGAELASGTSDAGSPIELVVSIPIDEQFEVSVSDGNGGSFQDFLPLDPPPQLEVSVVGGCFGDEDTDLFCDTFPDQVDILAAAGIADLIATLRGVNGTIAVDANQQENEPNESQFAPPGGLSAVSATAATDGEFASELQLTGTPDEIERLLNSIVFRPDSNFHGRGDLMIDVSDAQNPAITASANLGIRVLPVNDAPEFFGEVTIQRAGEFDYSAVGMARDVDGDDLAVSVEFLSGFELGSTGVPASDPAGEPQEFEIPFLLFVDLTIVVKADDGNGDVIEKRFRLGDTAWQNQDFAEDVNGDGLLTPLDVLLMINEINSPKFSDVGQLPPVAPDGEQFFDVEGDGDIDASDVIRAINTLNAAAGEAEGGPIQTLKPSPYSGPDPISRGATSPRSREHSPRQPDANTFRLIVPGHYLVRRQTAERDTNQRVKTHDSHDLENQDDTPFAESLLHDIPQAKQWYD